jgi:hypothetical protein
LFSVACLGFWILTAREALVAGLHIQAWLSKEMMQTVSSIDLSEDPLRAIWNIHIQPPVFDTLRALLAVPWRGEETGRLLRIVDAELYVLWVGCYALTGVVIFLWGSKVPNALGPIIIAVLYSIHPASVQYTTFLGTTIFTVLFIAVFEYLLWKIGKGTGSIILLAVVTILMIYTRSIFHWPFIIVCALSLLLLDQERRSIRKFPDIVMIAVGLLYVKQLLQFGII